MTKRRHKLFIVAAAWIATGLLCGHAAAAVRLELKLEKGKTYYERMSVDQRITQTLMGQEQAINHVAGVDRKLDVLDVDAQGNMRIRYTYLRTSFKQSGPMGTVDYDSSQSTPAPVGAEGFAAVIGEGYILKVSPKGKVLDVNGVEALAEAVGKKAPAGTDVSSPQNPVAFLVSKDGVREAVEGLLTVYPANPVEVGASWEQKRVARMGLTMIVESRSTLQKREDGVATIGTVATLKPDPNGPLMDAQGMKMKIDVSGTTEGTTEVDETTGLIKSDRSHNVLKGQIGVGASAEGPFDMMTIPVTFDTRVTFEMSERAYKPDPR